MNEGSPVDTDHPGSILKIDWAQKHLVKLESILSAFIGRDPYAVTRAIEGKRQVWRMHLTGSLDPSVSLIVGDILHNARAALEYAAAELVRPSKRDQTYFPVLTQSVWDIPSREGENKQTTQNRKFWNSATEHMPTAAVEIIKSLQPIDSPPKRPEAMPPLWALNNLANVNRHRRLSVVLNGMKREGLIFNFTYADGTTQSFRPDPNTASSGFNDGAEIPTPPGVVNVEVKGTPLILLHVREDWGNIVLPDDLRTIWQHTGEIIAALRPHAFGISRD